MFPDITLELDDIEAIWEVKLTLAPAEARDNDMLAKKVDELEKNIAELQKAIGKLLNK